MLKQHALNILRAWLGGPAQKPLTDALANLLGEQCAARCNVPLRHFNLANRRFPFPLAEALQLTVALMPSSEARKTAPREIATALENALDARRQWIIVIQLQANFIKW
jgi:hypothetical protein